MWSYFRQCSFSLTLIWLFFLLCPITLTHVLCQINLTPLFSTFACKSKISLSEYVIKKRRKKVCSITFAKLNYLDGNSFGYSSKLTGLLLKATKGLFQLFLKSVKTVKSKGQCRLNSFKKRFLSFKHCWCCSQGLASVMITKHLPTVIYSYETLSLSFQELCKHRNTN